LLGLRGVHSPFVASATLFCAMNQESNPVIGCKHQSDIPCPQCLKALASGNAIYLETDLQPQPGESLAAFQKRINAERAAKSEDATKDPGPVKPAYVPPSLAEQKRIIRDETVPEPIRRYWRERLYGKGGTGRKGAQQDRLQRETQALQENFADRAMRTVAHQAGTLSPHVRPRGMSGRQWKRAKRLLRQLAKVAQGAG
jgi:hypothetical protein